MRNRAITKTILTIRRNRPLESSNMSDQPNSELLDPNCQKCKGSKEIIHVITHECLEGDALRCVIKGVPDNAPLDLDDYVKVADLLEYLQGSVNVPTSSGSVTSVIVAPASTSTAIAATTSSQNSTAATSTPTSNAATSSSSTSSAPSVVTITATAGMTSDHRGNSANRRCRGWLYHHHYGRDVECCHQRCPFNLFICWVR